MTRSPLGDNRIVLVLVGAVGLGLAALLPRPSSPPPVPPAPPPAVAAAPPAAPEPSPAPRRSAGPRPEPASWLPEPSRVPEAPVDDEPTAYTVDDLEDAISEVAHLLDAQPAWAHCNEGTCAAGWKLSGRDDLLDVLDIVDVLNDEDYGVPRDMAMVMSDPMVEGFFTEFVLREQLPDGEAAHFVEDMAERGIPLDP